MTATEAKAIRDAALKSQEGEVGQRLTLLYKQIEEDAKKGLACTDAAHLMNGLNHDQQRAFLTQLKGDGYLIKVGSDVRDWWCIITWAN